LGRAFSRCGNHTLHFHNTHPGDPAAVLHLNYDLGLEEQKTTLQAYTCNPLPGLIREGPMPAKLHKIAATAAAGHAGV
jgi:hypothetical protein